MTTKLLAALVFAQIVTGIFAACADPNTACIGALGGNSCTANDLVFTAAIPETQYCRAGHPATLTGLQVQMVPQGGGTTRYDLGVYVSTSGGIADANTCDCYRGFFGGVASATSSGACTSADLRLIDGDKCGDADQAICFESNSVTITCEDENNDGIADVNICGSWNQLGKPGCNDLRGVVPGTGSKCECHQVNVANLIIVCPCGYQLDAATRQCVDINECAASPSVCGPCGICHNLPGSYTCEYCSAGFVVGSDAAGAPACVDYDECAGVPSVCGDKPCINTIGGFTCECEAAA